MSRVLIQMRRLIHSCFHRLQLLILKWTKHLGSSLGWVTPRAPKSGLSASTAKQNYLRRVRTECHRVVFGVLETHVLSATSSEGEDGFRKSLEIREMILHPFISEEL